MRHSGRVRGLLAVGTLLLAGARDARSEDPPSDPFADALEVAASLHPALYDVDALAEALGPGLEPSFAFVRDRIRWEAYPGVLRDADGALAARAGNAWDRALLLAALLERQGVEVRFARGRLPGEAAARLLARVFEPSSAATHAGPPGDGGPREGEPPFLARVRRRAAALHPAVLAALGERLAAGGGGTRAEALEDLSSHVWVQARQGDAWIDLDPSLADARPGTAAASATETFAKPAESDHQRVTVRVVAETLSGGSLERRTRLELSGRAGDLLDRPIVLSHLPPSTAGLPEALAGAIEAAAAGDTWVPTLWVEGEVYAGQPVAFVEQAAAARGQPPRGGLGGAFGPGGALSSGRVLVAEWLEVEETAPGGRTRTARRALVERASAAWREAGAKDPAALAPLARQGDLVCAPRETHVLWLSGGPHDLRAYAHAVATLAAPPAAPEDGVPPGLWPLAVASAQILVASDHLVVPSLHDLPGCRFHADQPRAALVTVGPAPGSAPGVARWRIDLMQDALRGVAREPSDEAAVVARKVWFGLLQGALEHEVCAALHQDPAAADAGTVSAISLLGGAGPVVQGSPAPGGAVNLIPKSPAPGAPAAWVEVDPDGTARLRMGEGLRGAESRVPGVVPSDPLPSGAPGGTRPPGRAPPPPPVVPSDPLPSGGPGGTRAPDRPGRVPAPWERGPFKPPEPRKPWWNDWKPPKGSPKGPSTPWNLPPPPGTPNPKPPTPPPGVRSPPVRPPRGADRPGRRAGEGGNEYLMVIRNVSLEVVFGVLMAYGPQIVREGSEWLAQRVNQSLADALTTDPASGR